MQMLASITSNIITAIISNAKKRLILAMPGIRQNVADAIVSKWKEFAGNNIKIILDTSEEVCRLGYGDIAAITTLKENGIKLFQSAGFRIGIFICDNDAWIFTPTALYIQSEAQSSETPNAIHVDSTVAQALAMRLSENERNTALIKTDVHHDIPDKIEIGDFILTEEELVDVKESLEQAPPMPFNIARQVHVFEPYIQYVDIKLLGAAIQKKKINLPHSIVNLGSDEEIQNRINTTFSLIEKNSSLSSKNLERELDKIRDDFTRHLGNPYGRVMLKQGRKKFDDAIAEFKKKVVKHRESIEKDLCKHLENALESLVSYYKPFVMNTPPRSLSGQITETKPSEQQAESWLEQELLGVFPEVDKLFQEMQVVVQYRDVTYETLKDEKFREQIKDKFPYVKWEKPFKEFQAISEDEKKRSR